MVKREHHKVDLIADDGDPVAQRAKVKEPDHLLCPITRVMFRDPVMVMVSGHTYERKAIEQHLRGSEIDPKSNVPISSKQLATNWIVRNVVETWLDENPGVTPDGWDTREMLSPRIYSGDIEKTFF